MTSRSPDLELGAVTDQPLVDLAAGARWLGYVALFLVVGACVFRGLALRALAGDPAIVPGLVSRARTAGVVAALFLLTAAAARLYLQIRTFSDPGEPMTLDAAGPIVLGTSWGTGWLWQAGAAASALAGFLLAGIAASAWGLAALAATCAVVAAALTGHALEHPWGAVTGVGLHTAHLLGGSVWLGTLFVLLFSAWPAMRRAGRGEATLASLVNAYSPLALAGAGTAMIAGLLLGYAYVGSIGAIFGSGYGRALLVKLALLGGVAALGVYNWRRVRPALGAVSAEGAGAHRLSMSATAELFLGTLLLAVTAVLVSLPAPGL